MRTSVDTLLDEAVAAVERSRVIESRARMATVSSVNGDGTVDVDIPDSTIPDVRMLSTFYAPRIGDRVEILRTAGGWVCLGALNSGAPVAQRGSATANTSGTNNWVSQTVSFPAEFAAPPAVMVTPVAVTQDGAYAVDVAANNITTSGFILRARRTSSHNLTCHWVALNI